MTTEPTGITLNTDFSSGGSFAGTGADDAGLDVFNNATELATFTGLVSDGSTEINFLSTSSDGGSRPRRGMNFLQITSIPEPSSALFLRASMGTSLLRRRRN